MSVVKINVLTVPAERREVLEQRFGARAGEVDTTPGFESFELLRPTDDSDRYFVVTRWVDEQAFQDWMSSQAFQRGHAGGDTGDGPAAGTSPGSPSGPASESGSTAGATPAQERPAHAGGGPAATGAELLSFEVVQESHA